MELKRLPDRKIPAHLKLLIIINKTMSTYSNMFEDHKTSKRFHMILESLVSSKKKDFSKRVKNLFDKKTISKDGEYESFKINYVDLLNILSRMS